MPSQHCCADTGKCGIQSAMHTVLTMAKTIIEVFSLTQNASITGNSVTKAKGIPKSEKGLP